MHADQKVGLALGVLLIGVVAAFFFRNEPDPAQTARLLANAAEIDREIAEKRLMPYFGEIQTGRPPSAVPVRTAAGSNDQKDQRTGERKLPRWEEVLQEADQDPFAARRTGDDVPMPAPDPILIEESAATTPTTRAAAENLQVWAPAHDGASSEVAPVPSATRIHEVQRGETLSSIAGRYLGSQARFHEIFAANRDQLQDPDDLKVGMKLRIPKEKANSAAQRDRTQPKTEPDPVASPPVDVTNGLKKAEEFTSGDTESRQDALPSQEPPVPPAVDAEKITFSPAKRRPARTKD